MTNLKIADFNDFVMLAGDQIVTDSRRVANAFDKRHGDVLRAVDRLDCGDEFWRRNFASRDYIDDRGKRWRLVEMTKDGFMFLVMGFTGKQAGRTKVAFIDAFNAMAEHIKLQATSAWREYQAAVIDYKKGAAMASIFGRGLRPWGVIKPAKSARLAALESRMQMPLLLE